MNPVKFEIKGNPILPMTKLVELQYDTKGDIHLFIDGRSVAYISPSEMEFGYFKRDLEFFGFSITYRYMAESGKDLTGGRDD